MATPALRPRRWACLVGMLAGLMMIAYGYAFRQTTLVVRTDLGPQPPAPEPADEPEEDDVDLSDGDWDTEEDAELDALTKELEGEGGGGDTETDPPLEDGFGDGDGDEAGFDEIMKEMQAIQSDVEAGPPAEQTQILREGGLIRAAAMGIVTRLSDGRLALTWLGTEGGDTPACVT